METVTSQFRWLIDDKCGKDQAWVSFLANDKKAVQEFIQSLDGKQYDVVIKPHKEVRGPDANFYMWVICTKIAKAMHDGKTTKEDIYREAIRQVGVWEDKPIPNEDVESHIKMWGMVGEGWFSEERRESKLKGHKVVRDYYGSHIYDKTSMSQLIDYIVEQAKEMNIETKTPEQIQELKERWGDK